MQPLTGQPHFPPDNQTPKFPLLTKVLGKAEPRTALSTYPKALCFLDSTTKCNQSSFEHADFTVAAFSSFNITQIGAQIGANKWE